MTVERSATLGHRFGLTNEGKEGFELVVGHRVGYIVLAESGDGVNKYQRPLPGLFKSGLVSTQATAT